MPGSPYTAAIHSKGLGAQFLLEWLISLSAAEKIQTQLWESSSLLYHLRFELVGIERVSFRLVEIDSYASLAEPLVVMARLGFISKRKKKWGLAVSEALGPDKIIGAYVASSKVIDSDGFPQPESLQPFCGCAVH